MHFVRKWWVLMMVLTVFILFKIPHLFYPYYWDESWLYAPGIMAMYRHGISLMPNAISVAFTRGHPVFYQALAAAWVNIFGTSHMAMHSCQLLISLSLIVAVYVVVMRLFSQRAAIIAVFLLMLDVGFFVESSFVLPDIMIALLNLLCIYFYIGRKYLFTGLFLTLLFYTKESAVVLALILGCASVIGLFNKQFSRIDRIYNVGSVFIPIILGMLFYVVQKQTMGWYLFPGANSSHADFDIGHCYYWFSVCLRVMFYNDYRYLFFVPLLALSVIVVIKQKNLKYAFLFLPAVFLCFLDDLSASYSELVEGVLFIALFSSIAASVYLLNFFSYFRLPVQRRFVVLCIVFLAGYIYYISAFGYQERFLYPVIIILCVPAAIFFDFLLQYFQPRAYYFSIAAIVIAGGISFMRDGGTGPLGSFNGMKIQQSIVDYFEQNQLYDHEISAGSYMDVVHLRDPASGYLRKGIPFRHVVFGENTPGTDYVIVESIDMVQDVYDKVKNDPLYHLVFRKAADDKWAEIYARNSACLHHS